MTKERLHIKGTSCLLPHHSAIIWLMYIFTVSHLRLELKKNPGSVYHDINSPANQIWCVCRGWRVQISGSNHCSSGPAVPTKVDVLLSKLNHFFFFVIAVRDMISYPSFHTCIFVSAPTHLPFQNHHWIHWERRAVRQAENRSSRDSLLRRPLMWSICHDFTWWMKTSMNPCCRHYSVCRAATLRLHDVITISVNGDAEASGGHLWNTEEFMSDLTRTAMSSEDKPAASL